MKRNLFIAAALEELQQEVAASDQTAAAAPAAPAVDQSAAAPVTEVTFDQSVDAVAALMEKNTELAAENIELQEQTFDNDVDTIQTSSDSVQQDLEEAVAACEALEELAHLADLTVRSGQANKATSATLAFALEQITVRAGLPSQMAALEAEEAGTPEAQSKSVGEKAKELAQQIGQKLVDGIQRIIAWVMSFFQQIFARTKKIAEKATALKEQVKDIDANAMIEDAKFIKSLRLLDGASNQGDIAGQYADYAKVASHSLYGFFNDSFVARLSKIHGDVYQSDGKNSDIGYLEIEQMYEVARQHIFTEDNNGVITAQQLDNTEGVQVSLTKPCVGGIQLFLATNSKEDTSTKLFFKTGLAPAPKLLEAGSIPVINPVMAGQYLEVINKWMNDHREIEKRFKRISGMTRVKLKGGVLHDRYYTSNFLSLLTGFATTIMPQLLRLNIQNSVSFIAYVEKSIAVSKAPAKQ